MTAAFGRIGEFEPEKEDWTSYVERLGHFFHANGIDDDDKKRSVFLSVRVMKIYTPRKYGHPGFPFSRDFRHPVVIIGTPL